MTRAFRASAAEGAGVTESCVRAEHAERWDRWYVLAVLALTYSLNIAHRYSMATLMEPIRRELHLSDAGVAFLTGVSLALFFTTAGLPIAVLADRVNRRNIVAIALAVWSCMTVLCGLAQNYLQLLLARISVGIGEAGGTPPSMSILADKFPAGQRAMAVSIFMLGASFGEWLGSSVAGAIAERSGWRAAFIVLGIPGIILAPVVWLTVREPRRGQLDVSPASMPRRTVRATLRFMATQRSAVHLVAGGSVASLWSFGLLWWTPAFLQRSHQMTVGHAGELLGTMYLVAGTIGILASAWLAGRPAAADPRYLARLLGWVIAAATIPSIILFWTVSDRVVPALLAVFVATANFFPGPALGLLQNVVPASMRATSTAAALFIANIASLIVGPQLIGWLSDRFAAAPGAGDESLRWALLLLAPTGFWAAWHLLRSAATIRDDMIRAG